MNVKVWMIILFLAMVTLKLALLWVKHTSAKNPIPANVADVYDSETYLKWQAYHGERSRLELVETLVSTVVMLVLLLFNTHHAMASLFGESQFALLYSVLFFQAAIDLLCGVPFSYISTMRIEEKYGFNRTTMKTFVRDQIIGFVVGVGLNCLFVLAIYLTHSWLGDGMVWLLAAFLCLFVLLANVLFPLLSRVQNKFTPLPEGTLREKLTDLLTRHGYQVKGIEVMDGSRRSSKSNAFFSGFGKQKRIVLYDTLLEAMDEDEICAVFAHELGHGLHHDIPRLLGLACLNMVWTAVLAWLVVRTPDFSQAFGFADTNYGFAFLLLGTVLLPPVMQLWGLFTNYVSCKAEYAADAQAVAEGHGEALVSALKKLGRENFSHLSPSKLVVALEYDHPPLSQRIAALEKGMSASSSSSDQ